MNILRNIRLKVRSLVQPRAVKHEIDEELRSHLEQRTVENIAAGMSPEEAARAARKRFGNVQSVREQCRETRGASFGDAFWQDVRFGAQMLRRNPGFTTVVLLSLALGIGEVSAVFSLVHGVLLAAPPYSKPEQIVLINSARTTGEPYGNGTAAAQWWEWRKEAKSFSAMAAYNRGKDVLLFPGGTEPVAAQSVTEDFFKVMGVQPMIGRSFLPSEYPATTAKSVNVVILGHELWQRRFHGDSNIIGQVIRMNLVGPLTVVGVMPPKVPGLPSLFGSQMPGFDANAPVDVWSPNSGAPVAFGPKANFWSVVGRLRDGAELATAQAELTAIAARQAQTDSTFEGITPRAELLTASLNRKARRLLVPLSGAVALVFLISCGSVTGLLLARGLQRQREFAVRCALGAGRWRLARQSLAESLLLAVPGGVLGAALAAATVKVLQATAGAAIPRLDSVTLGWPTLVFCFGATLAAVVIAGIAPAFRASRLDAAAAAKGGQTASASRADRRLLTCVATVQTALTLALLVGAGLLIRTVTNLAQVRPGYDTERIVSMTVSKIREAQLAEVNRDDEKWFQHFLDFHRRALSEVGALPGVKNAAWSYGIPLSGSRLTAAIRINGFDSEKFKDEIRVPVRTVTPEYFDMVGLPLLSGRNFGPSDTFTNRYNIAIINEAMARKYFPGMDPIGKRFPMAYRNSLAGINRPFVDAEIVGIAADSHNESLTRQAEPEFYVSFWQMPTRFQSLVVRTSGDPRSVIVGVQKTLRVLDPAVLIENVRTFDQIRNDSIAPQLFTMRLLTGFSLVAGALALIGVYGVLSLSVASRQKEMAIRMAVGAPRRNILALILREGLKLIGAGVLLGAVVALASTGILRALLFGVEPTDPATFAVVIVFLALVTLLACYLPARRAMKIDPMEALRYE